jgi:hypothetical protein
MLRSVKNIFWMLAFAVGAQSAFGFALNGPTDIAGTPDSYQGLTPNIGYNVGGGEDGNPKTLFNEYRRNTPVVYYAVDQNFWQSFSTNGVSAIDQAFAMYNSVGKVSQLDINDYPEDSRRPNYTATALGLLDLKSYVMGLLTTQMGFFEPTRWVWNITQRFQLQHPPGTPACPFNMGYGIDQRNYSIVPVDDGTYPTTSYVNGVLYSYFIEDSCAANTLPTADAVEFPVDPLSTPYSAVADYTSLEYEGLLPGSFYTSLTRDDVAGLKYLYATNNLNNEAAGSRVTEYVTNDISQAQVVTTQDLGALAAAAKVSNAATLQALFPGLTILSTSNYFGLQITTNITETLVNAPLDPAGTPPSHPIFTTTFTTNVVQFFVHTFGNIVTNTYATRGTIGTVTSVISNSPLAPAGSPPTTNTVVKIFPSTGVFGDFFILPTNTCSALIVSNILTTVTAITNLPTVLSNTPTTGTNAILTFIPGNVSFLTNHTLIYLPVDCPVDRIARHEGLDHIQFIRRDYDPIGSQLWDPITNNYTMVELDEVHDVYVERHFSRRVPRPDMLFSAANFSGQTSTLTYSNTVDGVSATETLPNTIINAPGAVLELHQIGYDETGRSGNSTGPGTIVDGDIIPTLFIFNNQFPLFENTSAGTGTTNSFINPTREQQLSISVWGSFDGTTNPPVVYPNGTSLSELENLINGPAPTTPNLPDGNIGAPYSAQLTAHGGTAPYTWSLAPTSPGLPDGLNISPDGKITGVPNGPASIYDFTVRITDSAGKVRDVQYTITIF